MEQNQLRQLSNTVEIVGTLKTKELEEKHSRAGNLMMVGKLVVLSKVNNQIHEHTIKVMVMATSKLYKNMQTIKNEYQAIDDVGAEKAHRVRITGELKLQEYYNSAGKLIQYNEVKGVFFNRLEPGKDLPDKAVASIETVIEGFTPILDKSQLPTGDYQVNGFTVGWGNDVIELRNAVVKEELAEAFMNLYQPGQTGRLTFRINNYVEVEEAAVEVPQVAAHGFGSTETVEPNVIKNYVSNLEVIGGDIPFFGTKEYTPEEIIQAKQVRNLKLQTLQPSVPETPPNTGFGEGAPSTPPSNDDMPDF